MIQIFSILIDRHYRNYYFLNSSDVNPIQSILTILFSSQSNSILNYLFFWILTSYSLNRLFLFSSGMGAGGMPGGGMGGMKTKMRGMMGGGGHMMKT